MEEKKKRVRPTWAQVRDLEEKLEAARIQAEAAVKDYQDARKEVLRLKNLGLWARIFKKW